MQHKSDLVRGFLWAKIGGSKTMGDKPGGAKKLDLTPLFLLFMLCIIIGFGSIGAPKQGNGKQGNAGQSLSMGGGCEQGSGCGGVQPEPKIIYNKIDTTIEYTVQVACFKEKKEAYWEAGRMRASQINNFVLEHRGAWYVCVGRYATKQRAQRRAQQLISYGVPQAVVFPPGKPCIPEGPPPPECPLCIPIAITIALTITIKIAIDLSKKKPSPSPPPPPPKCETTITITTTTKPDVKEAKKDG
jgi:hypothetical protein